MTSQRRLPWKRTGKRIRKNHNDRVPWRDGVPQKSHAHNYLQSGADVDDGEDTDCQVVQQDTLTESLEGNGRKDDEAAREQSEFGGVLECRRPHNGRGANLSN